MPDILAGKPVAQEIQQRLRHQLATLTRQPSLTVIMLGDNSASLSYIGRKRKMANSLGIPFRLEQLPSQTTTEQLLTLINHYNQDRHTSGILVQLPLPEHIEVPVVLQSIHPHKDVDGLSLINLGKLMANTPELVPATARGIVAMLNYYHIPIAGQRVVVIGRSRLVGQPIAQLLLHLNATVTITHRQTVDLPSITRQANILVVAAGCPGLVSRQYVTPESVVIDVGLTKTDAGLVGDVQPLTAEYVKAITPVPGGVGPLTVSCLFENVLQSARLQE